MSDSADNVPTPSQSLGAGSVRQSVIAPGSDGGACPPETINDHFTEDAIYDYIYDYECGGSHHCADDMFAAWSADDEWWAMLLAAEAGRILYGSIAPNGIADGSFFFSFLGKSNESLTGLQLVDSSAYGHGTPIATNGIEWSSVKLGSIALGVVSLPDPYSMTGEHLVRLVWQGLVQGEDSQPVWIRISRSSLIVTRAELEYKQRLSMHQNGQRATRGAILEALASSIASELTEAVLCLPAGPACGFAYAAVAGAIGSIDPGYAYRINSGPLTFLYSWDEYPIAVTPSGPNSSRHLSWMRTLR